MRTATDSGSPAIKLAASPRILDDGVGATDVEGAAFVALAMVPTGLGSMTIDLERVRNVEQWATDLGSPMFFSRFLSRWRFANCRRRFTPDHVDHAVGAG